MQARMENPAMILPEAMKAMQALQAATKKGLKLATRQVAGEWRP